MASDPTANVLVVEDDPGIAELERLRLEEAGYAVRTAATADEALNEVRKGGVDLILLDYRLPGGADGLDFHARVRAAGFDPPVILVTGFGNEATVIRALRSGVRDFVTKSVEYLDYLPEAVARVLRQVRTESRLAESEARLAGVIGSAKDAIIVAEDDRRISLFNAAAEAMFRCPAKDALGRPVTRFIPDELAGSDGSTTARLQTGSRGVRADGEEFPLEASVSRVTVEGRKVYTLVVRDVTERRRLEAERDALLTRLQLQVERMPLAYVLFDAEFRVTDWNPAAQRVFGYAKGEVLGMGPPFEKITPAEFFPAGGELVRRIRAGDMAAHSVNENLTKDGRTITCEWYNTPLQDPDGRFGGLLCLAQDVTDRRTLESQLRQAQKMEAVGQLAGGVAHDFNNLLTIINGYADILLEDLALTDPVRTPLLEVRQAGERAAGLTRQLLIFSRKQVAAPRVFDPNRLLREFGGMLRRLIGEHIDVAFELDPALGRVRADPGQVEQVVMNLCVNARDAMPGGGRLTIATRTASVDDGYAGRRVDVRTGRYAVLAVGDTGHGMDAATMGRIFEPFFTTKEPGKGTGLGLATVHGIVREAGGHVEVHSEPGRGTTFEVYLPVADGAETEGSGSGLLRVARGSETVLLAEDEDGVRRMTRAALQASGYTVIEAAGGEEAIRAAEGHSGPVHLLATDVIMPGMSGRELAGRLTRERPGLKVLYLSGYTEDEVVRQGDGSRGTGFLSKPFTPTALARKVREVLDEPVAV